MPVETHPASATLAAFARGDLPEAELSAVAEHIAVCKTCVVALEGVPDDTLAALARDSARPDEPAPTALASMPSLPDGVPDGLATHPRYKILGELGAGGMGVVYKAEDLFMGRMVALKVMTPQLTAKASAVERFRKEVRAAAQLNHPNIVIAHDTGEAGGRHFLVMEFVEGASLDRVITRKGPLPIAMATHFTRQAAQGLQHASEKGMVHRDIKPQNLMVSKKGHIKVMDFGIARFASTDDEPAPSGRLPFGAAKPVADAMTNPNLLLGTPDYLSPEQARNSHDVDTRSDVYSLGCTLYFLLTGRAPFAKAESLIDKLIAHSEQAPPPVRSLRAEVPEGLAEVLAKMMAKKPSERYANPGEAASALAPYSKSAGGGESPIVQPAAAGFEVIDAVVIAPTPAETRRPAASAAAFAFDTPIEPEGPTVIEPTQIRKVKRTKKAAPWGKNKGTAIGAAIAGIFLIVAIIAATGKRKEETPPDGGSAKVAPGTNLPQSKGKVATGGKSLSGRKILLIVPSNGVWLADYNPVRERLEEEGLVVETASADGGFSKPLQDLRFPGEPVKIDHRLTSAFDAKPFAAVVFVGADSSEYAFFNRGAEAARAVIRQMQASRKPVGALCLGLMALVGNDVLNNRRAAESDRMYEKMPHITRSPKNNIQWEKLAVVTDGKLVTGATDRDAVPFADALIALLKAD